MKQAVDFRSLILDRSRRSTRNRILNDCNATHIWLIQQADLEALNRAATILSEVDWRSIDLLAYQPRRTQAIAARVLLRFALSTLVEWKTSPSEWEFGKTSLGKPYVDGQPGISLSLSYSGNCIAVALSLTSAVAVDIEAPSKPVATGKLSAYLSARERMILSCAPDDAKPSAFLKIWTLKEALAKLLGVGVSEDLSSFDVSQCLLEKSNRLALGAVQATSHSIALGEAETGCAPGWLSLLEADTELNEANSQYFRAQPQYAAGR
jgi:4'-phosphopantetheinyl transferase